LGDLKKQVRAEPRKVLAVYPHASVDGIADGLLLKTSPPMAKTRVLVHLPRYGADPAR
jgi:hypothetical protein